MNPSMHRPAWKATPPEVFKAWQLRALRHYLTHKVLPFSAHYKELFARQEIDPRDIQSWTDWAQVPTTDKSDLAVPREQQRRFVLLPDEAVLKRNPAVLLRGLLLGRAAARAHIEDEFRPVLLTSTTGRSSDPVPFLYTLHDLKHLHTTGRRIMEVGGSRREFRHVNMFPYAPHLAFWQTHYAGTAFGTFMVSSGGGKTMGTDGNLALIDKIQPDIIIGMPTFIYHILRQACEEGRRLPALKTIVLGGEKVAHGLRRRLRDLALELGSESPAIISTYGFTEAKTAFPECPSHTGVASGFHLSPDLGIVEVVDPSTGKPVPDGEPGEIVYTPLDARGTVVLRYRTGDIAEGGISWEPCPHCGRACPRLLGPISRVSEVRKLDLNKIKGTLVDFNALEHLIDDMSGISAWQLELRKRDDDPHEVDELHLHLSLEADAHPEDVEPAVRRRFLESTELSPNRVHFHDLARLRDMLGLGRLLKEEKIVDHRPKSTPGGIQPVKTQSKPTTPTYS